MTTPVEQHRSARLAWGLALVTSFVGAAILFDADPGINWPIWVAFASAALVLSRLAFASRVETPALVLTIWATLISVGAALNANEFLHLLIVMSTAMLLGLAVITLGSENWSELSAKLLITVPFLAPVRVGSATIGETTRASGSISSPRSRALLRGSLLSIPLVLILIALLASADPVLRWSTDRVAEWLPDWSFPPRVIFFLFLLTLTLGANALAMRQLAPNLPRIPGIVSRPSVGLTEQRMMLWSAAVILWLFVLLQVSYLFQSPATTIGTGVTFAEFARRGFGELTFAATIVSALIIILEFTRPLDTTPRDRDLLRRLEIALIVALLLVLVSAFRRVVLYEQAYGFTTARLSAQAYMIGMALALAALAVEISRQRISVAFGRRVAQIALGVLTILILWNRDGWIANRNIDRAAATGKYDAFYATHMSLDAVPVIVQRRQDIPLPQRDTVEMRLACRRVPTERRWFEWNRNVVAATRALQEWQHTPCQKPTATTPPVTPTSPAR
jgi:hypothetical protein